MTSKEKVLSVYPDAELRYYNDGAVGVFSAKHRLTDGGGHIGWGQITASKGAYQADAEAWDDAASQLPSAPSPAGETASEPKKYMEWGYAGGPNECKHGYAAGIPCPRCDEESVPEPVSPGGAARRVDITAEMADLVAQFSAPEAAVAADNDLTEAFRIAVEVHGNQRDKSGAEPYMAHICRVASGVDTDNERVVAILHDVLEDIQTPNHNVERRILDTYGECVLAAVQVLTRNPDTPYLDYIRRVAQNHLATKVKLADLQDNMREDRLAKLPPVMAMRLRKKYAAAFAELHVAAPIAPAAEEPDPVGEQMAREVYEGLLLRDAEELIRALEDALRGLRNFCHVYVRYVDVQPHIDSADAALARAEEYRKRVSSQTASAEGDGWIAVTELRRDAQRMADAIRGFRNLPLKHMGRLRETDQYAELCYAWEKYSDKLPTLPRCRKRKEAANESTQS